MAWRQYHNSQLAFPRPGRLRDVYYPQTYRSHPASRARHTYSASPSRKTDGIPTRHLLTSRSLDRHGDLGWTLDYATAWCYKHLVANSTEVTDALDQVRRLEEVQPGTPFVIFNFLDRVLFAGKLKDMVYMEWASKPTSSPGTTSQADASTSRAKRICVELNDTLFEDEDDGDVDDLLDVLIHHMIHAYFLVTCGSIPSGQPQDGRLLDGVHFGVLMNTIRDISRRCTYGLLDLIFYAEDRRKIWGGGSSQSRQQYVAIDPRHHAAAIAPSDGRSHCCLDNRHVRHAEIKNWQVEKYSAAMDLDLESKGEKIWDYGVDNKFVEVDRLSGPASSTYVELIWDNKRVMAPRDKALKHRSILKPLKKDDKYELKVPNCSEAVFAQLYNFMLLKGTFAPVSDTEAGLTGHAGPPVIDVTSSTSAQSGEGVIVHLKLFKVAEDMKFEELESHILSRLWAMPSTTDDPVRILQELYNDKNGPVHAELHKWARAFLKKDDRDEERLIWHSHAKRSGTSNYEKVTNEPHWKGRFRELYDRSVALRDDCKLVFDQLFTDRLSKYINPDVVLRVPTTTPSRPRSPHDHSHLHPGNSTTINVHPSWWSQHHRYDPHVFHQANLLQADVAPAPHLLARPVSSSSLRGHLDWDPASSGLPGRSGSPYYYGRDGRRKQWLLEEGQGWSPRPWEQKYDRDYAYREV